jgi:hypothetical protein
MSAATCMNRRPQVATGAVLDKVDAGRVARAALAGFELAKMADGTWLASRWGMFRSLSNADEVERFLVVVGAPA